MPYSHNRWKFSSSEMRWHRIYIKNKRKEYIWLQHHYRVYNRNISKLKDIIQRTILRDTEYSKNISDNGMLRGDIIWKMNI